MGKKSNHRHRYILIELKGDGWFTHETVCEICGHKFNQINIDKDNEEFSNKLNNLKKELFKPTGRNLFD